jgi:predicted transcriptional regulator
MDVVWAAGEPVRVREVSDQLNRDRALAFNTVQTVMENLYRKGWLSRAKTGRAYWYEPVRSRDDYVTQLLNQALSVVPDPAATLVRLVGGMDPEEIASLRAALDAATSASLPVFDVGAICDSAGDVRGCRWVGARRGCAGPDYLVHKHGDSPRAAPPGPP